MTLTYFIAVARHSEEVEDIRGEDVRNALEFAHIDTVFLTGVYTVSNTPLLPVLPWCSCHLVLGEHKQAGPFTSLSI